MADPKPEDPVEAALAASGLRCPDDFTPDSSRGVSDPLQRAMAAVAARVQALHDERPGPDASLRGTFEGGEVWLYEGILPTRLQLRGEPSFVGLGHYDGGNYMLLTREPMSPDPMLHSCDREEDWDEAREQPKRDWPLARLSVVLRSLRPTRLSEAELETAIRTLAASLGYATMRDMGTLVKEALRAHPGAPGEFVARLARAILSGK